MSGNLSNLAHPSDLMGTIDLLNQNGVKASNIIKNTKRSVDAGPSISKEGQAPTLLNMGRHLLAPSRSIYHFQTEVVEVISYDNTCQWNRKE